jgi:hypothetical protein
MTVPPLPFPLHVQSLSSAPACQPSPAAPPRPPPGRACQGMIRDWRLGRAGSGGAWPRRGPRARPRARERGRARGTDSDGSDEQCRRASTRVGGWEWARGHEHGTNRAGMRTGARGQRRGMVCRAGSGFWRQAVGTVPEGRSMAESMPQKLGVSVRLRPGRSARSKMKPH